MLVAWCLGVLVSCQVLVFRSILAACVVTAAVGVKRCMRKACAGHSVGMRRAMFEGDPSCTRCSCVVLCRFVVSGADQQQQRSFVFLSSASSSPMHMLHMGI